MPSSSADCAFGSARFTSSTTSTLAKIGPGLELELPRVRVPDREPGDVRRLEVGRALDPRHGRAVDRAGERPGEHRLRGPGHVLEQDVPLAGEGREDEPDLLVLAFDDGGHVGHHASRGRGGALERRVQRLFHGIHPIERTRDGTRSAAARAAAKSRCGAPAGTSSVSPATDGQPLIPAFARSFQRISPVRGRERVDPPVVGRREDHVGRHRGAPERRRRELPRPQRTTGRGVEGGDHPGALLRRPLERPRRSSRRSPSCRARRPGRTPGPPRRPSE